MSGFGTWLAGSLLPLEHTIAAHELPRILVDGSLADGAAHRDCSARYRRAGDPRPHGVTMQIPPQQQQPNTRSTGGCAPHILLVDDDVDILDVLGLLFQEDGFRTSSCTTAQQATAILEAEDVHLLITDRRLVGSDGMDLVREVRQRLSATIPVILLTAAGNPTEADERAVVEAGSVHVVTKPFDIDRLAQLVHELVEQPA